MIRALFYNEQNTYTYIILFLHEYNLIPDIFQRTNNCFEVMSKVGFFFSKQLEWVGFIFMLTLDEVLSRNFNLHLAITGCYW